ncbi:phage holin family protein [Mobilitalea sibirica]|uniref:Phage holin family protein n=1 Tax=Mobilitalea sibirica TaxID=1462919 RepID=A0A8J7L050_9FIRM|nr:phage holin family protein [Mobilitalea sibirica]MBH1941628.1 phage holin family protein [Mobilitalea sibirica]
MNRVKALFTAFFSALAGWLGILAIPMLILVLCNLIDYATGLAASPYRKQKIDSYKSFRGIVKKVCMWLLVGIGAIVDWLIIYAGETAGITVPITFLIACIVAIWLICNEIISILENINDIGVKLPPFLKPLVKNIKKQVEDKATIGDEYQ